MFSLSKCRKSNKKHESIASIVEWQEKTFPEATLSKQLEKYMDERDEFLAALSRKDRLIELADMFIVACGISRFSSYSALECFEDIAWLTRINEISRYAMTKAIDKKMAINRRRKWNSLGGKYQHLSEGKKDNI